MFSVKNIEKKYNKMDNAVGAIDLDALLRDDQDKDKQEVVSYEKLCPTYFKLGKCLNGPTCKYAHSLTELGKTYHPLGRLESRRVGEPICLEYKAGQDGQPAGHLSQSLRPGDSQRRQDREQ